MVEDQKEMQVLWMFQDGAELVKEFYFGVSEDGWKEGGRAVALGVLGLITGLASVKYDVDCLKPFAVVTGINAGLRFAALFPRTDYVPYGERDAENRDLPID